MKYVQNKIILLPSDKKIHRMEYTEEKQALRFIFKKVRWFKNALEMKNLPKKFEKEINKPRKAKCR